MVRTVPVLARGLSARDPQGTIHDGTEPDRLVSFLAPAGLVMLMFLMIFVGATPLMQGVIEEKSQRIAEVLLGSVRPFTLMLGKLLGTVGVATTLAVVYLGGAYAGAWHYGLTEHLPASLIAWFLVYQTLGVLMFGSLFIAVGAACTSAQETQSLLLPVMLVAMIPLFLLTNVIVEPDGPLATGASLFPTAAPMLMVARLSVSAGAAAVAAAAGRGVGAAGDAAVRMGGGAHLPGRPAGAGPGGRPARDDALGVARLRRSRLRTLCEVANGFVSLPRRARGGPGRDSR